MKKKKHEEEQKNKKQLPAKKDETEQSYAICTQLLKSVGIYATRTAVGLILPGGMFIYWEEIVEKLNEYSNIVGGMAGFLTFIVVLYIYMNRKKSPQNNQTPKPKDTSNNQKEWRSLIDDLGEPFKTLYTIVHQDPSNFTVRCELRTDELSKIQDMKRNGKTSETGVRSLGTVRLQ